MIKHYQRGYLVHVCLDPVENLWVAFCADPVIAAVGSTAEEATERLQMFIVSSDSKLSKA